jgi:uncharacterized membrane protein YdbT with pleckstrin-like domain
MGLQAMGYVEKILPRDERVLYRAGIHWFIFVPGSILLLAGVFAIAVTHAMGPKGAGGLFFAFLVILVAVYLLLGAWITQLTTDIAVTTRRVIVKRGFLRRSSPVINRGLIESVQVDQEMNAGQIKSVQVDQSIFGRLFDFGTVTIRGTGSGIEPITAVAAPLALRKAVNVLAEL